MKNVAVRSLIITVLCFALIGCTSAQILSSINMALTAAEAILPIVLPLLNVNTPNPVITPARATEILSWVQSALNGIDAVSACQKSGGTAAQEAACITANLSGVVAAVPSLAGLPASIATAVQNLATELQSILKTYGTKALKVSASSSVIHYGAKDQATLGGFRRRAAEAHITIAKALAGK